MAESGIMQKLAIQDERTMKKKEKTIPNHNYKIWQEGDVWKTYVPDESNKYGRKLIKRKEFSDLKDAVTEYYIKAEIYPTVHKVFYEWIENKLQYNDVQKQTYDRYISEYKRLIEPETFDKSFVGEITEYQLEKFIKDTIIKHSLKVKGWSNLRTLLIGIFRLARKKKLTEINIRDFMQDIDLSKNIFNRDKKSDKESVYTEREVKLIEDCIISHHSNETLYLGVLLMFKTGLRNGELSTIKADDFNGNILHIQRTEIHYKDETGHTVYDVRESTKGRDGEREMVITKSTVELFKNIRLMNPFGEFLFESHGERIKSYMFAKALQTVCREVGISYRSPHKVRKTYGTKLLKSNVADKIVQKQMGHTEIETTRKYYYYDNTEAEEKAEIIEMVIG